MPSHAVLPLRAARNEAPHAASADRSGAEPGQGGGPWERKVKLSEQTAKISTPGLLQIRRFAGEDGHLVCDAIWDVELGLDPGEVMIDPLDVTRRRRLPTDGTYEDLLEPMLRAGRRTRPPRPLTEARARTLAEVRRLHPGIRRLANPHEYPVGLERRLHELRTRLILEARGLAPE